ncbi:MAG TPA: hypothetical protein VGJ02_07335 [Pyrinomonadaceae bacterium]|jgi:hypothetical protein
MKAVSTSLPGATFGFFELDDNGTVRYSRTRIGEPDQEGSLVGQNFFEMAGFTNCQDLRRHFRRFVQNDQAAESFVFDCFFDQAVARTKVTLTRAFQTNDFPPEKIVMLDIREIDS